MDAFMGSCILQLVLTYPPRGWLFCNGQTVPISAEFGHVCLARHHVWWRRTKLPLAFRICAAVSWSGRKHKARVWPMSRKVKKAGSNNATVISNGTATITLNTGQHAIAYPYREP